MGTDSTTFLLLFLYFFFFNDTATTEIYTLSLHDALPICQTSPRSAEGFKTKSTPQGSIETTLAPLEIALSAGATFVAQSFSDRKSTRLNSSHANISYAVFCLKKKKNKH